MGSAAPTSTPASRALFRALFDEHASYVAATLGRLGIAQQDRDDLVAEVFVRVHKEIDRYDPERAARPWLFAFAARVAANHRRLARHRLEILGEEAHLAEEPAQEGALVGRERRTIVEEALDALDDERRAVFVLHELDEISVPAIARSLGIPEGTAYSRLRAARIEFSKAARRIRSERSSHE